MSTIGTGSHHPCVLFLCLAKLMGMNLHSPRLTLAIASSRSDFHFINPARLASRFNPTSQGSGASEFRNLFAEASDLNSLGVSELLILSGLGQTAHLGFVFISRLHSARRRATMRVL